MTRLNFFTVVSGVGWCFDFGLFNYLLHVGFDGGVANLISASSAVTLVFFAARRWIFRDHRGTMIVAIAKYAAWNVVAITLASIAVALIDKGLGTLPATLYGATVGRLFALAVRASALSALTAKILVTPFTMYANFIAMGYIVERRLSLR